MIFIKMMTFLALILALCFAHGLDWQSGLGFFVFAALFSAPIDYEIYKEYKEVSAPIYPEKHIQHWGGRRSPETLARVRQSRKVKQEKLALEKIAQQEEFEKQELERIAFEKQELERKETEKKELEMAKLVSEWENK